MATSRRTQLRARIAGISLLILSLVHAPWPQPDFHNVRHQDAPGQVCEHHDHLLRWHPGAGQAEDVAVLHWHWFVPTSGPDDGGHSGNGPAIHAHLAGWDAPSPEAGPLVVPDRSGRPTDPAPPALLASLTDAAYSIAADSPRSGRGRPWIRSFGATFAPGISLASRLQRWSC